MLGVPLCGTGSSIGVFALGRVEPAPFTERQIELVTTFADQAVIAIENVRLFDEVQARTRDLEEALEQQTATAEVLKSSAVRRSICRAGFLRPSPRVATAVLCGHTRACCVYRRHSCISDAFTPISPEADAFVKSDYPSADRENFKGRGSWRATMYR